jgi:hypothetical protein
MVRKARQTASSPFRFCGVATVVGSGVAAQAARLSEAETPLVVDDSAVAPDDGSLLGQVGD